jgi:hypothetical protein
MTVARCLKERRAKAVRTPLTAGKFCVEERGLLTGAYRLSSSYRSGDCCDFRLLKVVNFAALNVTCSEIGSQCNCRSAGGGLVCFHMYA